MEPNDTASYWDGVRAQAEILIDLLQHGEHTSDAPFHDTSLNYPFVPTPDPTNHTSAHAHQTLSGHSSSTASRFGIANNGQQLDQHNGLHTAADFGASEFERVHTMLALQRDLPEAQLEDDRGGLQEWYGMTPTPDSKPFNIFHALDLVATRSNPQISSDATQARRSFVVMDTWQFDMPIIYVSDNFLHLTGYTHQDTIAQNCRFLQSPDGRVQPNVPRDHISSLEAYQLKQGLFRYAEFRQTIGNFRKNGEPFINLLTIIPISWDTDGTRFFFGFQLDVTRDLFGPELIRLGNGSQDSIVSRRKQKSTKRLNLSNARGNASSSSQRDVALGGSKELPGITEYPERTRHTNPDTVITDPGDATQLLSQLFPSTHTSGNDSSTDTIAWTAMTLESNGWMTLVLTLKGTILYISQACRALGYSSTDLVGSSILDICHPSDVANVLRELKSGSSDSVVDIISRFRKSDGKYIWVHNYGSVWTDSGRKCAILTGQIQHIPIVPRSALEVYEGVGDRDLWARISTTGLILAVFSSRKTVLGFGPTELQGTSFQCLLTNENMRQTFESLLGRARLSKTSAADLDISSAAGHTLQTETVLYTSNTPLEERAGCFILQCRIGRKSKPNDVKKKLAKETVISVSSVNDDDVFNALNPDKADILQLAVHKLATENNGLELQLENLQKYSKQRKRFRSAHSNVFINGCVNCHTKETPEWRLGPSGKRDLCNRCGLRYRKEVKTAISLDHTIAENNQVDQNRSDT